MAGRSVLQKVVSGMSRSRALAVVARGGASSGVAAAPEGIRTLSHLSHGGVAVHAGSAVPKFPATHTSKIFPSNRGIHGSATTRNFDCSRITAKPSYLTSRIPSVLINRVKPIKRTFSSTASTEHEFTEWEASHAKRAAQDAESKRFSRNIKWLYGFAGFNILLGFFLDHELKRIRNIKGNCKCKNRSRSSPICPSCARPKDAAKEWPTIRSGWWD